jgi:hypothetical protein
MNRLIESYLREVERRQESQTLIKMVRRTIESLEKIAANDDFGLVNEVGEALQAIADIENLARKKFTSYSAQRSDPSENRTRRESRDTGDSTE